MLLRASGLPAVLTASLRFYSLNWSHTGRMLPQWTSGKIPRPSRRPISRALLEGRSWTLSLWGNLEIWLQMFEFWKTSPQIILTISFNGLLSDASSQKTLRSIRGGASSLMLSFGPFKCCSRTAVEINTGQGDIWHAINDLRMSREEAGLITPKLLNLKNDLAHNPSLNRYIR